MSRRSRPFSVIAAIVLAVVALAHLARVIFAVHVMVGDRAVPISVSVIATIVAGALAVGVWRESGG